MQGVFLFSSIDHGEPVDTYLTGLRRPAHCLTVNARRVAYLNSSQNHRKRDPAVKLSAV